MTPTDILTAARATPLSPIVPAREEWLMNWIGPVCFSDGEEAAVYTTLRDGAFGRIVLCNDGRTLGYTVTSLRLDIRRPEVRDRLVRCGALPAPLRDHFAAAVAAAMGARIRFALGVWEPVQSASLDNRGARWGIPRREECFALYGPRGWELYLDDREPSASGPEEGTVGARTGRLAVDLAALSRGCVLEEADGWYVPLPDGKVGWLAKEAT